MTLTRATQSHHTCRCGLAMIRATRDWSGTTHVIAVCPIIAERHGITPSGELGDPFWIDHSEHQVWVQSKPSHPRSCCYVDEAEGGWT
jgi:hypothetical protein